MLKIVVKNFLGGRGGGSGQGEGGRGNARGAGGGSQGECEQRIEKKIIFFWGGDWVGLGGVRVDLNEELKFL